MSFAIDCRLALNAYAQKLYNHTVEDLICSATAGGRFEEVDVGKMSKYVRERFKVLAEADGLNCGADLRDGGLVYILWFDAETDKTSDNLSAMLDALRQYSSCYAASEANEAMKEIRRASENGSTEPYINILCPATVSLLRDKHGLCVKRKSPGSQRWDDLYVVSLPADDGAVRPPKKTRRFPCRKT